MPSEFRALAREQSRRVAQEALRLRLALQALPQPLVVWDEAGAVVLRNRPHPDLALPHSGEALIDAAVDDLVQAGVAPEPVTRTLVAARPTAATTRAQSPAAAP